MPLDGGRQLDGDDATGVNELDLGVRNGEAGQLGVDDRHIHAGGVAFFALDDVLEKRGRHIVFERQLIGDLGKDLFLRGAVANKYSVFEEQIALCGHVCNSFRSMQIEHVRICLFKSLNN